MSLPNYVLNSRALSHIARLCTNVRQLALDYRSTPPSPYTRNPFLPYYLPFPAAPPEYFQSLTTPLAGGTQAPDILHLAALVKALPNLETLCLNALSSQLTDNHYAHLVAARGGEQQQQQQQQQQQNGCWRQIEATTAGPKTISALTAHCATTLERLVIGACFPIHERHLIGVMASSPRLRVAHWTVHEFDAETFVDRDPATGQCRPWACEATLTDLRVHIRGIPRPDMTMTRIGRLRYPGATALSESSSADQSTLLQRQVQARLSRFHRLRRLQLGRDEMDRAMRLGVRAGMNIFSLYDDPDYQYECLEMTLATGLGQLLHLKHLRHLHLGRMATRVGPAEVEWMVQHWPQLSVLEGLCSLDEFETIAQAVRIAPRLHVIAYHRPI